MRTLALLTLLPFLASCFTLTVEPRALVLLQNGTIEVTSLPCSRVQQPIATNVGFASLQSDAVRITTWNIHKESDAGWEGDLTRLAQASDIILLQEARLQASLRESIESAKLRWIMASSFIYTEDDIGVVTASRAEPIAICTERVIEPLIRLPKSAVITWFRLGDGMDTLAIANVHAINFSLSLEAYRSQFDAIAEVLGRHKGPIVLAGDFNTWTQARSAIVSEIADRLALSEITFASDERALFFGRQLDHILVRGVDIVDSSAVSVKSSDHNPVTATLRVTPRH